MIAGWSSTNPNFSLEFPARLALSPQQSRTLTVRHVPPIDATEPELADLRVWTDEGVAAAFHASSLPPKTDCTLPASLAFGAIVSGESKTLELPLQNSSSEPSGAAVELSSTSTAFATDLEWYPLPAGASRAIQVTFSPVDVGDYSASLLVRRRLCAPQTVRLDGECVVNPNVLTWTPKTMNFAAIVGSTVVQTVTLRNTGSTPIELSNVEVREATSPPVFRVTRYPLRVPEAQTDATGMIVPGEATVEVSYHATVTGQRAGTLTMDTSVLLQPSISIGLRGSSGIP